MKPFENLSRPHNFDQIRGFIVVMPRQAAQKNGRDITQLFDRTTHGLVIVRRNMQEFFVDGPHAFPALKKLSELHVLHP